MRLTPKGIRTHLGLNKPIYAADRRLRPFRPQARGRPVHLGEDRPGRRAEGGDLSANLYELFAAAADAAGETPVFVEGGEVRLRYAELDGAVGG